MWLGGWCTGNGGIWHANGMPQNNKGGTAALWAADGHAGCLGALIEGKADLNAKVRRGERGWVYNDANDR